MFSATKFVVAGVIVALFGGFLLTGALQQQLSDESTPVVGVSTSAVLSPTIESATDLDPITDPSGFVTTVIDVAPMQPRQLVRTSDAVWALSGRSAARIDLDTHEVDIIKLPVRVLDRQIVDGSLWGTNTKNKKLRLVEIDLATGELLNTYPMPQADRHWAWSAVIAGDLWFWGWNDQLARFDLVDREFTIERAAGSFNPGLCCLATDDAIWITRNPTYGNQVLRRFDVETLEVTDKLPIPRLIPGTTADGDIWVWQGGPDVVTMKLLVVDEASRAITDVIYVSSRGPQDKSRLALSGGGIWALLWEPNEVVTVVSRIDIASGEITHTIDVGGTPESPLAIDDAIWVPVPEARRVIVITPETVAATA